MVFPKPRLTLFVLWSEGGKVELVSLVFPPVSDIPPLVTAPLGKLHGGSDEGGRTHTAARTLNNDVKPLLSTAIV